MSRSGLIDISPSQQPGWNKTASLENSMRGGVNWSQRAPAAAPRHWGAR